MRIIILVLHIYIGVVATMTMGGVSIQHHQIKNIPHNVFVKYIRKWVSFYWKIMREFRAIFP